MNENNAVNPGFNTNHTPDKKLEKFELVKGDYMFSIFAFVISVTLSLLVGVTVMLLTERYTAAAISCK